MKLEPIWGSVLDAFAAGVQLDLRARLAIEFLKSAPGQNPDPKVRATDALECATEFIRVASERGMVKALPEGDEINRPLRDHIGRSTRANIAQQVCAQKIGPEEQPKVQVQPGNSHLSRQ